MGANDFKNAIAAINYGSRWFFGAPQEMSKPDAVGKKCNPTGEGRSVGFSELVCGVDHGSVYKPIRLQAPAEGAPPPRSDDVAAQPR